MKATFQEKWVEIRALCKPSLFVRHLLAFKKQLNFKIQADVRDGLVKQSTRRRPFNSREVGGSFLAAASSPA
jgi:hypothetical protein